jgi:hypothetical protein
MFLRGTAGAALAIPLLPSVLSPKEASAAPGGPKRFVQFCTHHGGVWGANMFPRDAVLTEKASYAGHEIRRGALARSVQGSRAGLVAGQGGDPMQAILSADASVLTDRLAAKINVLRGIDITFYIGHHTGGHLGNYARNDGNGDDGKQMQSQPRVTIDQVMAWSSAFYGDLSAIRKRAIVVGDRISYAHSNPAARSGPIGAVDGDRSSRAIFDSIYVAPADAGPKRTPVVDRVLASYKRLRNGNARLSAEDKRRLDDHIARIAELDRRLGATGATCGSVTRPTKDSNSVSNTSGYGVKPELQAEYYSLMNDVIVAAFLCGTSRIAVVNAHETFSDFSGDWHQGIAHQCALAAQQKTLAGGHRWFFEKVWLDLVRKLDAVEDGAGGTLLDSCLVTWTQESGNYTHDAQSIPIVTAGSAAGALRTGQYCDYRNLAKVVSPRENPNEKKWIGLTYEQWLTTVLLSMGIPNAEIEAYKYGGQGVTFNTTQFMPFKAGEMYPGAVLDAKKDWLPFLRA